MKLRKVSQKILATGDARQIVGGDNLGHNRIELEKFRLAGQGHGHPKESVRIHGKAGTTRPIGIEKSEL